MANRNSKVINMDDKQRQQQVDEKYLQGKPTRLEVANYVNALLEQEYMPAIQNEIINNVNSMKLGIMILQGILVNKGICTGEEIEQLTNEFIENYKKELEEHQKKADEESQNESTPEEQDTPTEE